MLLAMQRGNGQAHAELAGLRGTEDLDSLVGSGLSVYGNPRRLQMKLAQLLNTSAEKLQANSSTSSHNHTMLTGEMLLTEIKQVVYVCIIRVDRNITMKIKTLP
jgi:hypothetical protein